MATATVRNNHLTHNGIHYFRANSEEIEIGTYGEKRTPIFGANYLETYRNLPIEKIKIDAAVVVDIDFTSTSESDFAASAQLKILGVGGGATVGNVYSKLRAGELKLVKFSADRGDIVEAINAAAADRERINDLGNDARVAHQIFVVMEATLAETFASATSFAVTADRGDINVEAKGSLKKGGTTKVTLSEGSTFAYLLLDLKWDHASKRKRTRVVSAHDDQWSLS